MEKWEKNFDFDKINRYMSELNYKFGVYIELSENRKDCLVEFGQFDINL